MASWTSSGREAETENLSQLVIERLHGPPPHLVGVGGAVAVGKSTIARALASALQEDGRSVRIVSTDAFLLPNAVLSARGLQMRKGFPESYDNRLLTRALSELKAGDGVRLPVYSHEIYDIVEDDFEVVGGSDLVVIEGIIALQEPVIDFLDCAIYVDADESFVREWFVSRFLELVAAAENEPVSFYRAFAGVSVDDVRRIAEATWDGINGVNLADHIRPSMSRATFVVQKDAGHAVVQIAGKTGA